MTRYLGTLYFLGQYRPLYVTADSPEELLVEMSFRAQEAPEELRERIASLWRATVADGNCIGRSVEHGCYGASWREGDRPAIDPSLWEPMPPCPGLIYN